MRAEPQPSLGPNLWKGLLAGALGGLIASFAMGKFYSLLPLETSSETGNEDSTVRVASAISQKVFHHDLTPNQKTIAGPAVHYVFGMTMAAAYGALVEHWDIVRFAWGLPFGATMWLGAHVIAVPVLGFSEPINVATTTEAAEIAAHLVYGAVVEGVRRTARKRLL